MTCELRIAFEAAADPREARVVVRRGARPWLRFFVRSSHGPLRESGDALLCFGLLPALELGCRLRVEAAADAGIEAILVETDLPRRMHPYLGWIEYHGSALAGIRHLLADRFGTMLVAASCDEATAWECPWGSHPGIDPQLGTAAARIAVDGLVVRYAKIARLLSEPQLLRDLRVCYHGGPNCGACKKCVFTRHCLAVLGVDRPPNFPDGPPPAGPFSAPDVGDRDELVALRDAAAARGGHGPLVAALDAALAAHVRGMASLARRLSVRERIRRLRHRGRFLLDRGVRAA